MTLARRDFLRSAAASVPAAALAHLIESAARGQSSAALPTPELHVVPAGADRLGTPHSLGMSSLAFKVLTADTGGNLFVIEHSHLVPGGPPLHLHLYQDEWFYVMEGEVVFQVGEKRVQLKPGESVLGPRRVPHTFSSVAEESRMLIAFTPARMMEKFFVDGASNPRLALTAEFMNRYEMEWIGPSPFAKNRDQGAKGARDKESGD
jgi:mannose-6-phosphate isomerase-like protein (cupin superfamily)